MKIILLETSDTALAEIVRTVLEDFGFLVTVISERSELLIGIEERAPDLVVLHDQGHGSLDNPPCPVLLIGENKSLACSAFLSYPFSPMGLLAEIYALLGMDLG